MIFDLICIFLIFFIAHYLDLKIRDRIYTVDIGLAEISAKNKPKKFEEIKEVIDKNNLRYGIVGKFEYDMKPNEEYIVSGKQTNVGTGVVTEKKSITKKDIIDDMAKYVQESKKKFVADSSEVRDRHIVIMYIQNAPKQQDALKQFIWDDEGLYNNVDIGDKVSVSYAKEGVLSVGYRLKGE